MRANERKKRNRSQRGEKERGIFESKCNPLMEKWEEIKNRETLPQTPEILRTENNLDGRSKDDASGIILNMAVV
jgi:hypothetical protein